MITGDTRFAVILGHPVRQVKTPTAFNAWAASEGVDAVMIAVDVTADHLSATLTALRGWQNCLGAVVTYPHKQQAVQALDTSSDAVRVVGATNVIHRAPDGSLHGGMTDGLGFVAALAANGFDAKGADVRLIGAGGAGSAIALALADAGAARLLLHDIDTGRRRDLADRLRTVRPAMSVPEREPEDFDCALVVNATPVGMNGDPGHPFPLDRLPPHCFVADIVPSPPETAWINEARRSGHPTQTGPEMVACQLPSVVAHLMGG